MSSGRMRREDAEKVIEQIKPMLMGPADFYVCGSYRRGKAFVGDLEIVALADDARGVLARLDLLEHEGMIQKARYKIKKTGKYTNRWGDRYRGFCLQGSDFKIEVFMANPNNFGFIQWLRTGPGDANHALMTWLYDTRLKFEGGYATERATGRRIRTENEHRLFEMLGMPFVYPFGRDMNAYQVRFDAARVLDGDYEVIDRAVPGQLSMF